MGGVLGVTASALVVVASGFALLVSGLSSLFGLGGAAAAAGSTASGSTLGEVLAGSTLLALAGARDPQNGAAPRHAASEGSPVGVWAWVPVGGPVLETATS